MNDQDYIRKAVELADGWIVEADKDNRVWVSGPRFSGTIGALTQPDLDTLAAQLVRQVDATEHTVIVHDDWTDFATWQGDAYGCFVATKGPDRTMNTIKIIVDSKCLEKQ